MAIIASLSELSLWVLLCLSLIPSSASRIALTNRQYDDHKWNEHMKMLAENPHRRMVSKKEKMLSYLNASSLNKINFERHRSLAASSAAGVIAAAIESARQTVIYLPLSLPGTGGVVGDEVLFELMDGPSNPVTGTIRSVTTFGAGRFVWSGSLSRSSRSSGDGDGDVDEVSGGTFYVSWVNGAMIGNVYLPVLGMQYEYRPLDRSAGAYSLREVPMAVYDEEGEDDEQPHDMRAYNQMMGIRMGVGVDTIPTTTTTATTTTTGEGDGVGVGSDAAHVDHTRRTGGPVEAALEHKSRSKVDTLNTDTNNIVDVMVLYTPEAFVEYGSDQDSMDAFVDLTVSMANDAYENSNIDMRMRLVRGAQILDSSYVESGFSSDLSRLQDVGDTYFDADVALRDGVGADAVVLIVADGQYCGLGYLWASTWYAYSLISIYCPQSLVHEVGHNVGAHHDRDNAGSSGSDSSAYNFGWCWDMTTSSCKRSVMAYSGCTTSRSRSGCPRDFYFSSPLMTLGDFDQALGTASDDNARVHNEEISRVINWVTATESGGIVFSISTSSMPVDRCQEVTIEGWRLGDGSDITSVTLNGVEVVAIISQTQDEVVVQAGRSSSPGDGDIVVTSSSQGATTLVGGFAYTVATSGYTSQCDSASPTQAPTLLPTLPEGETYPPTLAPSTTQPSSTPSSIPTITNSFPYTTGILTNTASCTQNTVPVYVDACPGDVLAFSTCSNQPTDDDLHDTYIRLYKLGDTTQLAYNDDRPFRYGDCSQLTYTVPSSSSSTSSCQTYVLHLGCYSSTSCQMTATVEIDAAPTIAPTASAIPTVPPSTTRSPTTSAPSTSIPTTSVPTTSVPTTATPTVSFSPSFAPSTPQPSHAPTTATPSTARPSATPSTSAPSTAAPTPRPSATPSNAPSDAPTTLPTAPPSAQPSHSPAPSTATPTSSTYEQVEFSCTQSLAGVSAEQFLANASNTESFVDTVADAVDVSPDSICCVNVTNLSNASTTVVSRRHRHRHHRVLAVDSSRADAAGIVGIDISYLIRHIVEEGGQYVDADSAYSTTIQLLTDSVSSGEFLTNLEAALSEDIVSGGISVQAVSSSDFSSYVATTVSRSASPTASPTQGVPGSSSSSSSGSSGSVLDSGGGALVYAAVALVAIVVVAGSVCLYCCCCRPAGSGQSSSPPPPPPASPSSTRGNSSSSSPGTGTGTGRRRTRHAADRIGDVELGEEQEQQQQTIPSASAPPTEYTYVDSGAVYVAVDGNSSSEQNRAAAGLAVATAVLK